VHPATVERLADLDVTAHISGVLEQLALLHPHAGVDYFHDQFLSVFFVMTSDADRAEP